MKEDEIKRQAKADLKGNCGTCILSGIITVMLTGLSNLIPFGGLVTTGPFAVGLQGIYNKITDGDRPEVKDLFKGFSHNFGENFLVNLLKAVFIVLWSLLLVIPGIIKGYSYSMAEYLMARNTEMSASDAIKTSMNLMNGHKMDLFLLHLSFIGWILLTILTFGILALYVAPYQSTAQTEFFNEIYEGSLWLKD